MHCLLNFVLSFEPELSLADDGIIDSIEGSLMILLIAVMWLILLELVMKCQAFVMMLGNMCNSANVEFCSSSA